MRVGAPVSVDDAFPVDLPVVEEKRPERAGKPRKAAFFDQSAVKWEPTEAERLELEALMARHASVLRQSSLAKWQTRTACDLKFHIAQIMAGTFIPTRRWSERWLAHHILPDALPASFPDIVASVEASLSNAEAEARKGGWWPPVDKATGRRKRMSLDDFILVEPPCTGAYSPWLEFSGRCAETPDSVRDYVPSRAADRASELLEEVTRGKDVGEAALVSWWTGVERLTYWRRRNRVALNALSPTARLVFGTPEALVAAVASFRAAGGFVPYSFVYPGSRTWGDFVAWLRDRRGVRVPESLGGVK